MGLRIHLQRRTNFSDALRSVERKFLKRMSIYCTKCNEINACHLEIKKLVSHKKWFKYCNFFCIQIHTKNYQYITDYEGGILKRILSNLYRTN